MTIENSNEEPLVGDRAHERANKAVEDITSDGRHIYEAFLEDPDALVTSKEDVQQAKNAFDKAKIDHPEIIEMCQRENYEKCVELISSLREAV